MYAAVLYAFEQNSCNFAPAEDHDSQFRLAIKMFLDPSDSDLNPKN